MQLIACQQQNFLRAIHSRTPLLVDLVGEQGAPFSATFSLFDDPAATNLRGLWRAWTLYEEGEVVYLTPEGAESGQAAEHTPDTFSAWVAKRTDQHSEPGKPGSQPYWAAMKAWDLSGKTAELTFPGDLSLNVAGTIVGGSITVNLTDAQTIAATSSQAYRLELREGTDTLLYVARGQIVFRSLTTGG